MSDQEKKDVKADEKRSELTEEELSQVQGAGFKTLSTRAFNPQPEPPASSFGSISTSQRSV